MFKNLIMGFATNQDQKSVEIFCKSALQSHADEICDVVIITNNYEDYFLELENSGVKFFYTTSKYSGNTSKSSKLINRMVLNSLRISHSNKIGKFVSDIRESYHTLIETWHHPHFARWFAYKRYLEMNRTYGEVFLADVKDVAFQRSVFKNAGREYLNLFKQNVEYGDDDWDTKWYREAWGRKNLSKVEGKPAICIGTLAGSLKSILALVTSLTEFYAIYPFKGIEQAGFNYMIYNDMIDIEYSIVENIDNQVATLTSKAYPLVEFDGENIIRKNGKSVIPAVHMYDRFADTMKVAELY